MGFFISQKSYAQPVEKVSECILYARFARRESPNFQKELKNKFLRFEFLIVYALLYMGARYLKEIR